MSIATIKAAIGGQIYNLTLAEDGYYTLSGTAPALSSANLPGGCYGVQIIVTDDAGNETTINQDDSTWGRTTPPAILREHQAHRHHHLSL